MARQTQTELTLHRQQLFEKSLIDLLHVKSYQEITVTDICLGAQIPRRTFYHYFDGKEAVMDALIENMMLPCFHASRFEFDRGREAMQQCFARFFRFWFSENQTKLNLLLENGQESRLIAYTTQWIRNEKIGMTESDSISPKVLEMILIACSAGFFSLLFHWSRNGYRESPEEMAEYITYFLTKPLYTP